MPASVREPGKFVKHFSADYLTGVAPHLRLCRMTDTSKAVTVQRFAEGQGRERVRELHGKGLSRQQIAKLLDITPQAVGYHLRRIEEEKSA